MENSERRGAQDSCTVGRVLETHAIFIAASLPNLELGVQQLLFERLIVEKHACTRGAIDVIMGRASI